MTSLYDNIPISAIAFTFDAKIGIVSDDSIISSLETGNLVHGGISITTSPIPSIGRVTTATLDTKIINT